MQLCAAEASEETAALPDIPDNLSGLSEPRQMLLDDSASLWALLQQANQHEEVSVPEPLPLIESRNITSVDAIYKSGQMKLTKQEQHAAASVVAAGAVGSFSAPLLALTTATAGVSDFLRLAERGILQVSEDVFGELQVRLAAPFLLQPILAWRDPVPLSHAKVAEGTRSHKKGCNKLEFVRGLLRTGWKWPEPGQSPEQLCPDSECIIPSKILGRSESCLKCLFLSRSLFQKPGNLRIMYYDMPQQYYDYLLLTDDLTLVAGKGRQAILAFLADQKAARRKRQRADVSQVADISDHENVEADDEASARSLAELPDYLAACEVEPGADRPQLPKLPPVNSRVPGIDGRIYFDNYSHSSGRLRCFAQCPSHRDCRLYLFVDDEGRDRSVAKLLCWLQQAARLDRDRHLSFRPSRPDINVMLERQITGV